MVRKFNLNNIFSDNFVRLTGKGELDVVIDKIKEELDEVVYEIEDNGYQFTTEMTEELLDVAQAAITAVLYAKEYDPKFCETLCLWLNKQEEHKKNYGVSDDV